MSPDRRDEYASGVALGASGVLGAAALKTRQAAGREAAESKKLRRWTHEHMLRNERGGPSMKAATKHGLALHQEEAKTQPNLKRAANLRGRIDARAMHDMDYLRGSANMSSARAWDQGSRNAAKKAAKMKLGSRGLAALSAGGLGSGVVLARRSSKEKVKKDMAIMIPVYKADDDELREGRRAGVALAGAGAGVAGATHLATKKAKAATRAGQAEVAFNRKAANAYSNAGRPLRSMHHSLNAMQGHGKILRNMDAMGVRTHGLITGGVIGAMGAGAVAVNHRNLKKKQVEKGWAVVTKDRESKMAGMRAKYAHSSTPTAEKVTIENIARKMGFDPRPPKVPAATKPPVVVKPAGSLVRRYGKFGAPAAAAGLAGAGAYGLKRRKSDYAVAKASRHFGEY